MQNHVVRSLFILLSAVIGSNVWGGVIYKCKNQKGILVYQNSACMADAETLNSWEHKEKPKPPIDESGQGKDAKKEPPPVLTLKQNVGGHYATDGNVDGKSLNFVVDTGASFVSLPESLAHDAQIYCDDKIGMNTANGKADACTAKIKKLQFGPFYIEDVAAVIVPNLNQPLLGMNVLQLFKVAQEKGEMHISVMEKAQPEPETK
ncbi:clan AA aspartic protease, TIGR02281 family [Methyloglobulus morosus KoM1]|uniref:Clan AA aspartic protease, TIGR02281 family n=1 Tax=Methyloglobulus morosus KoM1 TaxID=1116472 RepID=V5C7E7_9GAMM|nr:retropepsin-like aspartic protease [Methyloglobulus morosus]ESS72648.1 clan AA aspartic protease, TIGR02281 family [Methyloglobulus morosus KoM1]